MQNSASSRDWSLIWRPRIYKIRITVRILTHRCVRVTFPAGDLARFVNLEVCIQFIILNTKSIILNTKSTIVSRKFIIWNANRYRALNPTECNVLSGDVVARITLWTTIPSDTDVERRRVCFAFPPLTLTTKRMNPLARADIDDTDIYVKKRRKYNINDGKSYHVQPP